MALRAEVSSQGQPSDLTLALKKTPAPPPRVQGGAEPERPRKSFSLQARALFAASLALFAFLGLTGFALERAFYQSSLKAFRERLQSYVWAYLSGSDVNVKGKLILSEFPPDPRFDRPQSGLYAAVRGKDIKWQSPSALGAKLPFDYMLGPRQELFLGPIPTQAGNVFVYSLGVNWAYGAHSNKGIDLTFHVAENESSLIEPLIAFRKSLWTWLGVLGVGLVLVQLSLLRWSLRPLRKVEDDLAAVESGEKEQLSGRYPKELSGLAHALNSFIDSERHQRARYRNTLSDLAHSLKTPLAVLGTGLGDLDEKELRGSVEAQVARMNDIVAYQLTRAATSGHQPFSAGLVIEPFAEQIVASLEKIYVEKRILCEFELDGDARFYGEQGDLMEILGNLLENAFKWAKHRVVLTIRKCGPHGAKRPGLEVSVEDDGPGIAEEKIAMLLKRGVRGDERVQGHGIGLSIVQDIVKAHRGNLSVSRSPGLGGAKFAIGLPSW